MRILITGGAGFIGANLCRTLAESADVSDLVVLDDLSTGAAANLAGLRLDVRLDVRLGSILDREALDGAMDGCDAVVHLAAIPSVQRSVDDPVRSHLANASGTIEVLEAARRHGNVHVITASSSSVYGATPTLPKHEQLATRPLSPYAASKLAAEAYTLAYGHSYGLPTLALRFFNVYGPLQRPGHAYAAAIPAFIDAALTGNAITVHGDGEQSRDFTYVDTVADVITDAIARGVSDPEPVNLAFGTRTTLNELLAAIGDVISARDGPPIRVEHVARRAGDVVHSQADGTRLAKLFPTISAVDLVTGLRSTVEWMSADIDAR